MLENFNTHQKELLTYAARLVTEEGLAYGPAKQMALRNLNLPKNTRIPDNDALELAIREHIEVFLSDTQPTELLCLRELTLLWLQKLKDFSPFVSGAVWHGLATKQSDIYLHLYSEDPKMVEIFLINNYIQYTTNTLPDSRKNQSTVVLTSQQLIPEWRHYTLIHLFLHDQDDIKGALKLDSQGRTPQGNLSALQKLLNQ